MRYGTAVGGLSEWLTPRNVVLLWGLYTLMVLGWLGYREALAGFFCGAV